MSRAEKSNPKKHHGSAMTSAYIVKYHKHGIDLTEITIKQYCENGNGKHYFVCSRG